MVFKDSQAVAIDRVSSNRIKKKREQYLKDGLLVLNDDHLVFTKDYEFSSPSDAAGIIRGGSSNGLINWKNKNGVALKDLE